MDDFQSDLAAAVDFAQLAHGDQTRKGKPVPYVSHLLQVAGLVLQHGGDLELAQAAVLHDVLEDCEGVSVEDLRERFGERVAHVAAQCSDLLPGDTHDGKSRWEERKPRFIARLERTDASVHLVVACDKLHNLRDLVGDLRSDGRDIFERFSASPAMTLWYYQSVAATIEGNLPLELARELGEQIELLASFVPEGPEAP